MAMNPDLQIYTLDDLHSWDLPSTWLAVIGDPIAHSLSPAMHNAALAVMAGEDAALADWHYVRFQIPAERLAEALPAFHQAGFRGINLTLPHKVQACSLVKSVSPEAQPLGAVNTLTWTPAGYAGTNTDGCGIARAVEQAFGIGIGAREMILLGAGGASRSVAFQALRDGAPRLWIGNRSRERLEELVAVLQAAGFRNRVEAFLFDQRPARLPADPLIVNATSSGLRADDALPFSLDDFGAEACFYDTTYGVDNAWAKSCKRQGIPYSDGLPMLVWQGARSLEIWTGRSVPASIMEEAARRALQRR